MSAFRRLFASFWQLVERRTNAGGYRLLKTSMRRGGGGRGRAQATNWPCGSMLRHVLVRDFVVCNVVIYRECDIVIVIS